MWWAVDDDFMSFNQSKVENDERSMMKRAKIKRLIDELDQILWDQWDPIGVNNAPEARDEYSSYSPVLLKLLCEHATEQEVLQYLRRIETVNMGLAGTRSSTPLVAARLIEWAKLNLENDADSSNSA